MSKVRGYLIDVNHISAHFSQESSFMAILRTVPPHNLIRLSVVTLGEIHAGHEMTAATDDERRRAYRQFIVDQYSHLSLEITASTTESYAAILGRIWRKHPPANKKVGTDRHLLTLGVHTNDVWLAASGWEHGLIVLTRDGMSCIQEVMPEVVFKSWL